MFSCEIFEILRTLFTEYLWWLLSSELTEINYGLIYIYIWLYIHIHRRFSLFDANVLNGFMISLFLVASVARVQRAWNLMGTPERNELWFLLLFGKKYCLYRS